ncbi:MAG TPA: hypothetical protein PLS49_01800 [Candidatus Woesebacteria bacterium]|nr:hypothetical protein [Candidatus Woesebacteria bacterium]
MKIKDLANQLVQISPRFAKGEEKTAEFISQLLKQSNVDYIDQEFETSVPVSKKAELIVDGKVIDCRNVGMTSGTFENKDALASSLFWGDNDFYYPQNINFNPYCKDTVSMAMFYKNAAIAIKRSDVQTVLESTTISGETVVEQYSFIGHNFLVGNRKNPTNIIFTHYDCWESGAIDNASGTAVLLYIAMNNKEYLQNNLLVIAGNEEISMEEPIYWGKGYRAFQSKYLDLLQNAKKIICIDCVGYSEHEWITDPSHIVLGLPLDNFDSLANKASMLSGDFYKMLEIYHSNDDTIDLLDEDKLKDATEMLLKQI